MIDCCSTSRANGNPSRKHRCPVNGKEYLETSSLTVMHHIKKPWNRGKGQQAFYFCEDQDCDVVYFTADGSVIEKSELRTSVGVKDKSKNALVCYCFGVTQGEAATNPDIKAFVVQQTKQHACACESRNPSGRCCLKDFPRHETVC